MVNLMTFFRNHFDTKEISDDRLRKFSEDHLQRLAANNGNGEYTDLIAAATAAYNGYFGAITDEDTRFAIQQGLTRAMQNIFEEFKKAVSQKEGMVRALWGKESPEYQEFFPLGLREYAQATLATVETLMSRMADAAERRLAALGQPFADQFADLKSRFLAARAGQLQKFGAVADSRNTTRESRDELEIQLMKSLLTLALKFTGDGERGLGFFDQSIIRPAGRGGEEEEASAPEGTAPPQG